MSRLEAIPGLSPQACARHPLHGEGAAWPEKNCYADLWIGVLAALGLQPMAMLGFTVAVDFEQDQWTFFKPPLAQLRGLYGVDVQELTVWRPLLDHVRTQLAAGRLVSTESDAYWLPDTAATDYRRGHAKTTILVNMLDEAREQVGYFHNSGYCVLEGEDYRGLFRLGIAADPAFMPFFAELVKVDRRVARPDGELARIALPLLREHAAFRPATNPFPRFAAHMAQALPQLQQQGLARYHAWAFAGIRQAGAAFELAAAHLRWLAPHAGARLAEAAGDFDAIAQANKTLILKGARAVNSGKPLDAAGLLGEMAAHWDEGMRRLDAALA